MSAIKNGIKELHCKESLSGKRFKRSIAHNNLKLTCNIYHIQVFKLPFLQIGLYKITSTDSGDEFSSLLNSVLEGCSKSCTARKKSILKFVSVLFLVFLSLRRVHPAEVCEWGSEGDRHVGEGRSRGEGGWGEVRWERVWGVLNNWIVEKHLVHTTTINFNS